MARASARALVTVRGSLDSDAWLIAGWRETKRAAWGSRCDEHD